MSETYQCLRDECKQVWRDEAGPVTCPVCGSLYVKWVSYDPEKYELICGAPARCIEERDDHNQSVEGISS